MLIVSESPAQFAFVGLFGIASVSARVSDHPGNHVLVPYFDFSFQGSSLQSKCLAALTTPH